MLVEDIGATSTTDAIIGINDSNIENDVATMVRYVLFFIIN